MRQVVSLLVDAVGTVEGGAAVLGSECLALRDILVFWMWLLYLIFKLIEVIGLIVRSFQILSVLKRTLWSALRSAVGVPLLSGLLGCLWPLQGPVEVGASP